MIRLCAEADVSVTTQGGNTGLVGGQIPAGEILLSTERLSRIREVDLVDDVIVAEAGGTLAAVHEATSQAGRFFPLSLASEGTATISLVSTNAGGTAVLRWDHAGPGPGPGGGAAGRNFVEWPQAPAQGQHRL